MSDRPFIPRVADRVRRAGAPMLAIQWLLRHIPRTPVQVGILCFLQLDGVPEVRHSWLRGPGVVRAGSPADLEALAACRGTRALFERRSPPAIALRRGPRR
jgi:hypothetical protein